MHHDLVQCVDKTALHTFVTMLSSNKGPFKCYITQMRVGGGGVSHFQENWFNIISVTRGWVGPSLRKKALRNT